MKGIMIQGTGSDVGKSFLATALCRIFYQRGYRVTPFKSQNMSNNSYVTVDGKEIGRAQGIQAEAAHVTASVDMNPILLKPRNDRTSEVVLLGESYQAYSGIDYRDHFYELGISAVKKSLERLNKDYELLVIEGAGSPVEMNLNDRELVNMKVAELADVPVILVADIERGGVFANIVGTLELLTEAERARVKGIIINKFRGDMTLFEEGVRWIEERTSVKVVGVLPYLHDHKIESEDSLSIASKFLNQEKKPIDIAVIRLPFISNYTDVEPFLYEEDVSVRFVGDTETFGSPDAVIIPGTRSTIADLDFLKEKGLDEAIVDYAKSGGTAAGICGGYQMMCDQLIDEAGTDTGEINKKVDGLGLIPAVTRFQPIKKTVRSTGVVHRRSGLMSVPIEGYEIHLGRTDMLDTDEPPLPFVSLQNGETEGVCYDKGRIIGTYFHHLFHNDEWRTVWLNQIRKKKGLPERNCHRLHQSGDHRFDLLAKQVETYLDIDYLTDLAINWEKHE
ncbi:cobyric acid synthase [Scopulibacillus cellulosilyticus]|uniref:Cobyric acid synthase n=1 Tax=Scopulibacillus cellulosilyticus TaxID=2665665 RepID=A0ABW2PRB2_9BACL